MLLLNVVEPVRYSQETYKLFTRNASAIELSSASQASLCMNLRIYSSIYCIGHMWHGSESSVSGNPIGPWVAPALGVQPTTGRVLRIARVYAGVHYLKHVIRSRLFLHCYR